MILGFTIFLMALAAAAGLLCVGMGLAGRSPSDLTLGAAALVEVALIVQVVVALMAPGSGNAALGSAVEFWIYLIVALILPVAAGFWGLLERSKWSTVILGVALLTIAVMVYRMQYIWTTPIA